MKTESSRENKSHFPLKNAVFIGLYGGLLWGAITELVWYLNFIDIDPNAALKYVQLGELKKGYLKMAAGILFYVVCSVIAAVIYYALFRKKKTPWTGVWFGVGLWVILFMVAHPLFQSVPSWRTMNNDTLSTTLCLFLLFGLFIGYSISYGYEHHKRIPQQFSKDE
ncbi:YqhR family membrane protein [Bacillus xiapuensis]|uniref:YqhR family membrane protein n=1 Tax=Bacillus xiapuensis TaxID=2014075 RepID=UPI000C23165E|nr:YqhR family membrane protein [Bacillus xiapuensis]